MLAVVESDKTLNVLEDGDFRLFLGYIFENIKEDLSTALGVTKTLLFACGRKRLAWESSHVKVD